VGPGAKRKEVTNACHARVISECHNVRSAYSIDIPRRFLGNARVMMSIVYAAARRTACQWNGQARCLRDGQVAAYQRSG
jgi:hypothetical protein